MRPFDIRDNIPDEPNALSSWIKENYGQGMLKLAANSERNYSLGPDAFALLMSEVLGNSLTLDPEDILSSGEKPEIDPDMDPEDIIELPLFEGVIDSKKVDEAIDNILNDILDDDTFVESLRKVIGTEIEDIDSAVVDSITDEVKQFLQNFMTVNALIIHNESRNLSERTYDDPETFEPTEPEFSPEFQEMYKSEWFRLLKRD